MWPQTYLGIVLGAGLLEAGHAAPDLLGLGPDDGGVVAGDPGGALLGEPGHVGGGPEPDLGVPGVGGGGEVPHGGHGAVHVLADIAVEAEHLPVLVVAALAHVRPPTEVE